jgi:hypothetical protein
MAQMFKKQFERTSADDDTLRAQSAVVTPAKRELVEILRAQVECDANPVKENSRCMDEAARVRLTPESTVLSQFSEFLGESK